MPRVDHEGLTVEASKVAAVAQVETKKTASSRKRTQEGRMEQGC